MGAAVQRSYSLEQIERALLELAKWHGSATNAARTLGEQGSPIPATTLQDWKTRYADRYAEVQSEMLPELRATLAAHQEVIARRASEVTLQVIESAADKIAEIPARDLGSFARNMEVTAATAIDKHSIIHEFPTEIVQRDSAEDILKRLQQKHPGMFHEGTAEEISPAEGDSEAGVNGPVRQLPRADTKLNARAPTPAGSMHPRG